MDYTMKEICEMFNTGKFNEIAMGYALEAMRGAKLEEETIWKVISRMQGAFDDLTAEEALAVYYKR